MRIIRHIPFNKPCVTGHELEYVRQVLQNGHLSGDGPFTRACEAFLQDQYSIPRVMLTPSCTAALEMSAMLCELLPGDEVIMPSYTFVTTALAFVRVGATPVFVDIRADTLNIDEQQIEAAITPRTRAICVVHYAGVACEMDSIREIADRHNLILIEDAAQAVDAAYKGRALGTFGDLATFSFHETKNLTCGEGGALCVNNLKYVERAEILRDKGTNRKKFYRGQVDKYTWVDTGSSYTLSEPNAAILLAQLEYAGQIKLARQAAYHRYLDAFKDLETEAGSLLPVIPMECESNFHLFRMILPSAELRNQFISHLNSQSIQALFHYIPLHQSKVGAKLSRFSALPVTESLSGRLVRLPLYFSLTAEEQDQVVASTCQFFDEHFLVRSAL